MYARGLNCDVDGVRILNDVNLDLSDTAGALSFLGDADSGGAELALLLAGILPRLLLLEISGEFRGVLSRNGKELDEDFMAGYVAPDPADQIVGLSVQAELEWAWSRSRLERAFPPEDLDSLLEQLNVAGLMERSTGKLSSGQRQRLAIASIAIANPDLLILDNCFSSLDRMSVGALTQYVQQREERELSTWIVGHPGLRLVKQSDIGIKLSAGRVLWAEEKAYRSPALEHSVDLVGDRRKSLYQDLASAIEMHCSRSRIEEMARLDITDLRLPSELGNLPRLDIERFVAEPGESTGIRGENGSGKSSLLSVLAGLEGRHRRYLQKRRIVDEKRLCYLPPDGIPAWISGLGHRELWPLAGNDSQWSVLSTDLLQEDRFLPIADGAYRSRENPWRRLWWIASSIHADIGWLFLDEPTTGMDEWQEECLKRILLAHAKRGGSALVVSHNYDFLLATCRRMITLDGGRILQDSAFSTVPAERELRCSKALE